MGEEPGRGRRRALCGFVGRASAGESDRPHRLASCGGVQRPAGAAAPDGNARRVRGRRALSRVAAAPARSIRRFPVHAPLVFDLVDGWNQRAIAGCVYHVAHPGGRQLRAVSRQRLRSRKQAPRAVRERRAHARRRRPFRPKSETPTFPFTLDLRRPARHSCDGSRRARLPGDGFAHPRSRVRRALAASRGLPAARRRPRRAVRRRAGSSRPHYDTFVRSLEALGRHELASRWENAKRAIRDNGVTYNVYGDPEGVDRPWTLDMIPLLVPVRRMEPAGGGPHPARARAQPAAGRSLRTAAAAARTAASRRRWCSAILASFARATASRSRAASISTCTPWTSRDRLTGNGGCWPIGRRRHRAPATRWRIASSCRAACPRRFATARSQRLASFFWAQRDTLTALAHVRSATRRASCCSRRAR